MPIGESVSEDVFTSPSVAGPPVSKLVRVIFLHELFERRFLVPVSRLSPEPPFLIATARACVLTNKGEISSNLQGRRSKTPMRSNALPTNHTIVLKPSPGSN